MTSEQTFLLFLGPALALCAGLAIYGFAMLDQRRYARADREKIARADRS